VVTHAPTASAHLPYLDSLRGKGIFAQFYDPDAERHSLPTYPFRWAPKGLYTVRQLRAMGLRPGGQDIAANPVAAPQAHPSCLPLPRRPGQAQAHRHPGPAHRHQQSAPRPPHLPHLPAGKALLHPDLNRRMQ
jgi:hypothetical protein